LCGNAPRPNNRVAKLGGCFALLCGSTCTAQSEDLSSAIALDNNSRGYPRIDTLPSPKTMYLCSGWGEKARTSLQAAITQVFDQNSIFTGKLVKKDGCYFVLPGFFQFEDLFIVKEGPSVSVPSSTQERVTLMQAVLVHHFRNKRSSGVEELANVLPLFQLEVLTLPAGMACICLSISHMLVDGVAYHTVVQLISDALQGKEITPMVWKVGKDSADRLTAGFCALTLRIWVKQAMQKLLGKNCNPGGTFVVDTKKCADLKQSLKRDVAFLSTNDLIVAAMAEVLPGRTTVMFKTERGRVPGIDVGVGGNQISVVCGCVAGDPVAVRKLVSMDTATTNETTLLDLVTGNFHLTSNITSDATLAGAGLETLVCCLDAAGGMFPFAVITKANQETTLVTHSVDAKELQILARGKLLSHLMIP